MKLAQLHYFVLIIGLFFFSWKAHGVVYEVGGGFSYDKRVYGVNRNNSFVSRTYSSSLALYFLYLTGIELNFSKTEDINTENERVELGNDITIVSTQSRANSETYGIGIRQAFAPRNFFLVPTLSIGYAKLTRTGVNEYTFESSGDKALLQVPLRKVQNDSVFATFSLKMRLTRTIRLNGSVRTVFKAFEYNQAKDYLKYEAGLSWMF